MDSQSTDVLDHRSRSFSAGIADHNNFLHSFRKAADRDSKGQPATRVAKLTNHKINLLEGSRMKPKTKHRSINIASLSLMLASSLLIISGCARDRQATCQDGSCHTSAQSYSAPSTDYSQYSQPQYSAPAQQAAPTYSAPPAQQPIQSYSAPSYSAPSPGSGTRSFNGGGGGGSGTRN